MSAPKTARNEEIVRLYVEEERTTNEIAALYDISVERVRQLLVRTGVTERHHGLRRQAELYNATVDAHTRIAKGVSTLKQEAEIFDILPTSLSTRFHRFGLHPVGHVAQHGTKNFYDRYKCRCEECTAANREYMRTLRSKEPPQHGTASGYGNYGCRCLPCRKAAAQYRREHKAKRLERMEV